MYISVRMALIVLFMNLHLDYPCAIITAPYHSYRSRVETIMAIVSLGMQAVALVRDNIPEEMEAAASRCNSLKALCKIAEGNSGFRSACLDSCEGAADKCASMP